VRRSFLAGSLIAASAQPAAAETPVLTVYAYGSFTAEWGPGPPIETAFEAVCGCDLVWVSVDDGVALLTRLKLEGAATSADIVLGLDTNLTAEAAATGLFAPHAGTLPALDLPVPWTDPIFVPFDWSYFAFVYDTKKVAQPPKSLKELVDSSDLEITIQDPRISTPGLGLLLWMKQVYGDGAADAWARLAPRVLTVTPGWSESYGLFRDGEVPMTFSYVTSPAYHRIAEQDDSVATAYFAEGQYLQIEVAGRIAASDRPALADAFLAFLVSPEAQALLPTLQWMYPVVAPPDGLPPGFDPPSAVTRPLLYPSEEVAAHRAAWIAEWLGAMAR
jgi:thiamine transport system substrate-binding protein